MMQSLFMFSMTPRPRGFSLIEVLVALLVLSIGLLGLAGLQTLGLKFNTQSYQRTQAVLNSYDIIDRIRANPGGVAADVYDNIGLGQTPDIPATPDCSANPGCTATDMADYNIDQWLASLSNLLTQGDGVVCNGTLDVTTLACDDDDGPSFQVGIRWTENDIPVQLIVEARP